MNLLVEDIPSESQLVQAMAKLTALEDVTFHVVPDGSWGIIITKREGKTSVALTGSTTKPVPVSLKKGDEILSIAFKASTFMSRTSPQDLLNKGVTLPDVYGRSFRLGTGDVLEIPTAENVDAFVRRLISRQLLLENKVVEAALSGRPMAMSPRTLQRHFVQTTGMTQNYYNQIERAKLAASWLESGKSLAQVALEAGYADQSHMTRSLKFIIGRTPSEIRLSSSDDQDVGS